MYCGVTCKQGSLVEGALIREGRAADRLHLYTANDRALTGEPRLTVKADGTWVVS